MNKTLEFLDLQNNQLSPECGQYLSDAVRLNNSLKTLGQFQYVVQYFRFKNN